ncbi:MAG: hypothetical protein LBS72_01405 [Oscillospiraceae bacterium]|nr:hypothetical protein [Oscillospiraceae bacterium]
MLVLASPLMEPPSTGELLPTDETALFDGELVQAAEPLESVTDFALCGAMEGVE